MKYYYIFDLSDCNCDLIAIVKAQDRRAIHKIVTGLFPSLCCATMGIDYYGDNLFLYIKEDEDLYIPKTAWAV